MRTNAVLACALLAGGLALGAPNASHAATCRVSATSVRFGNYNPLNATPVKRVGHLTIRCNGRGTFVAALSTGDSGSYAPRYMLSGTTNDQLDYNLYTNVARTIIWGDGTAGTQTVSHAFNNNRVRRSVYGQIPAQQNIAAGKYADSITATVSF